MVAASVIHPAAGSPPPNSCASVSCALLLTAATKAAMPPRAGSSPSPVLTSRASNVSGSAAISGRGPQRRRDVRRLARNFERRPCRVAGHETKELAPSHACRSSLTFGILFRCRCISALPAPRRRCGPPAVAIARSPSSSVCRTRRSRRRFGGSGSECRLRFRWRLCADGPSLTARSYSRRRRARRVPL